MLIPCLEQLNKVDVYLPNMIADMGYIDGADKITAIKDHGVAVCTEVKKNMLIPEACNENGRVICPEGHLAIYYDIWDSGLVKFNQSANIVFQGTLLKVKESIVHSTIL